jgi:pimeloyl-ACP methyl ester carboxylesterase
VQQPPTRYATSGDVSIAYQVTGDGPFDLVWVQGFISHVELAWDMPALVELIERLSSFCRLIRFDKRGTGMSDRVSVGDLETRMDDVRAVMDAAGSSRAALFGTSEGGPMSILFAATYPERVWALALWSTFPRVRWAPDYEFGESDEDLRRQVEKEMRIWGDPGAAEDTARDVAPGLDDTSIAAFARLIRQGASPGSARALIEMSNAIDVREALPAIGVPTLAAVRSGDDPLNRAGTRYIAERIPGARYVELAGAAHAPAAGDQEAVVTLLRDFVEEAWAQRRPEPEADRVLVAGETSSSSTTRRCGASSSATAGSRWTRQATASSHASTARPAPSAARSRSSARCGRSGSTCVPASTRASASSPTARSRASRSRSAPAWPPPPHRAKCSSPAP